MKRMLAVLLCALVLLSSMSVLCFAEYPVEGRDEPSVETAVENTIGKYIPTGKSVADGFFRVLNSIKDALSAVGDSLSSMTDQLKTAMQSMSWVPGWMK